MENFLWSVHLTAGWYSNADFPCLFFNYICSSNQSKKNQEILHCSFHVQGPILIQWMLQRKKKISTFWEEKEEKLIATETWLYTRHYFPGIRSIIIYFFLPTIIRGKYMVPILWMGKLMLRGATNLSPDLLHS